MAIRFASTFISHSSVQKALAFALARELTRRGMLAWIDVNELPVGVYLDQELRKANREHLTVTALISAESLASSWCNEELAPRLEAAGTDDPDAILPVFLGPMLALVKSSPLLRSRWLRPDGAGVSKLGISVEDSTKADPALIARQIAKAHYERLALRKSTHLVVAFDQRGRGRRLGAPDLPPNWQSQPWSCLVFRPDQEERSEGEVLHGSAWEAFRDAVVDALGDALGTRRRREVYLTGHAQLSLAWLAGHCFDQSSQAKVITYNPVRGGQLLSLDMDDPRLQTPLAGVDEADVHWHGATPDPRAREVSLYLGPSFPLSEKRMHPYENGVHEHRATAGDSTALAIRGTDSIDTADDVIALARWVTTAAGGRSVRVYTALPFHAVVLLAALLKHAIGNVTFMEWERATMTYHACPMPRG